MRRNGRGIAVILCGLAALARPAAGADPLRPPDAAAVRLLVPNGLPRYEIEARVDLDRKRVTAREKVTFTNRSAVPVRELVFHGYPHYQVKPDDLITLSKTLEVLRLSPDEALDERGRRMEVTAV